MTKVLKPGLKGYSFTLNGKRNLFKCISCGRFIKPPRRARPLTHKCP